MATRKKRTRRRLGTAIPRREGAGVGKSAIVTAIQGLPTQYVAKCRSNARVEATRWVKHTLDKGVAGLREEFLSLKRYVPEGATFSAFQGTFEAGKSRYKDVPCQDNYRVLLRWPGTKSDFIHANYITTPVCEKRFICTQGPLPRTVADFWHMVIKEEVEIIVMLTSTVEKGMVKCEQYWPNDSGQSMILDDVEVKNKGVRALTPEELSIRVCSLVVSWRQGNVEKSRLISHHQWVDWPDRGVPPCRLTAMVLLSNIRGSKKPIVVHCSAGIGRTGAIVAIEVFLEKLQQGTPCESMELILKEIRSQRLHSIQNDLQYLYINRVMLFYFVEKYKIFQNNEEMANKYKQFVIDYDRATT